MHIFTGYNVNKMLLTPLTTSLFLPDGAECSVPLLKPGQTVAARLLGVIMDLEQAHTTFKHREKEESTSLILTP